MKKTKNILKRIFILAFLVTVILSVGAILISLMSKGMGFVNYDSEIRSMYSERLSEWVSGFPDVEVARLVDVTYNAARQDGEARYQIGDRTDNHFYELHFKADRELTYLRLNKVIEVENLIVSDLWAGVHEFASEKAMNEEAVD